MSDNPLASVSSKISQISLFSIPPYIHCSKINSFFIAIQEVGKIISEIHISLGQSNRIEKSQISSIISMLNQFKQLYSQCSQQNFVQFIISASVHSVYSEIYAIRNDMSKIFSSIGFQEIADLLFISQEDLDLQEHVDMKRISQALCKIKEKFQRKDIIDKVNSRIKSLEIAGVNFLTEHTDSISIPDLPESMSCVFSHKDLKIGNKIGEGVTGCVHRGVIKETGQVVAVKILNHMSLNTFELESLQREIFTMSVISHPSLLQLYGYTTEAPYFVITELMSNGSLYNILHEYPHELSPTDRTLIAIDIARGMEYLHSRGILHRDLKSHNILLDSRKRPKICDFGLVRYKSAVPMTGMIGTIGWMAPEILTSMPLYDEKVDVYSFGIVLWELLTGEEPYDNMENNEIINSVVNFQLRPEVPEGISEQLSSLIISCWSHDPSDRPSFQQICNFLTHPQYHFPGCKLVAIANKTGYRNKHYYSNSSPMSVKKSMGKRRIIEDHISCSVHGKEEHLLASIEDSLDQGHIESLNTNLNLLKTLLRSSTVDDDTVVSGLNKLFIQCPGKSQARIRIFIMECLAIKSVISSLSSETVACLLSSLSEEISCYTLYQIIQMPKLSFFTEEILKALLPFWNKKEQSTRENAVLLLLGFQEKAFHLLINNNDYISSLLFFSQRKLNESSIVNILDTVYIVMTQSTSLSVKSFSKLYQLLEIMTKETLRRVAMCIGEGIKFMSSVDDFPTDVWNIASKNIDYTSPVFCCFFECLPKAYEIMIAEVIKSCRYSVSGLNVLFMFSEKFECASFISKCLPLCQSPTEKLSNIYFNLIKYKELHNTLIKVEEFYSIIQYLIQKNAAIPYLNQIFANYQPSHELIVKHYIPSSIVNVFRIEMNSELLTNLLGIVGSCIKDELILEFISLVSPITKLMNLDDFSISPSAFYCSALMLINHYPSIDIESTLIKAAKFIHSKIPKIVLLSSQVIKSNIAKVKSLDSMIKQFTTFAETKNENTREISNLLHQEGTKRNSELLDSLETFI